MVRTFFMVLGLGIVSMLIGIGSAEILNRRTVSPVVSEAMITQQTMPQIIQPINLSVSEHARKTTVRVSIPLGTNSLGKLDGMRGSAIHLANNIFLSVKHVCDGMMNERAEQAYVTDYKGVSFNIISFQTSKYPIDLCILKVAGPTPALWPETKLAPPGCQVVGSTLYIGSYSGGQTYSFRAGPCVADHVTDVGDIQGAIYGKQGTKLPVYMAQIPIMPGASGGGVINGSKELVGIMALVYTSAPYFDMIRDVEIRAFLPTTKLGKELGY